MFFSKKQMLLCTIAGIAVVHSSDVLAVQVVTGSSPVASGTGSTAVGENAQATGAGSTAVGDNAQATGAGSTAVGNGAQATAINAIAIGSGARAPADDTIYIGANAGANNPSTNWRVVAIGSSAGSNSNGEDNTYLGYHSGASTIGSANVGVGDFSLHQMNGFFNTGLGSLAGQNVTGDANVAVGARAGSYVTGTGNVAVGAGAGRGSDSDPLLVSDSTSVGTLAGAKSTGAVAIGSRAFATAERALALGASARASHANSVALGPNSTTSAAVGTASSTLLGTSYNFAGATPVGTVSIGSAGAERTITNVAAGNLSGTSTDAVNGSQLFATNQALNTLSTTSAAGWNISADGANSTAVGTGSTTGNAVDLSNTDGNIVVGKTATSNDVTFDLADDVTIANSLTVGGTTVDASGITANALNVGPNFSVSSTGANYSGPITDGTHIANKDYVDNTVAAAANDIGVNFTGNDGGVVRRTNGQTLSIRGDASTAGNYDASNIRTATDAATGEVIVQMASAPRFGNVVINDGESGRITGVTAGILSQTSNHAVNGSQIVAQSDQLAAAFSSTSTYNPATNTFSARIAVGDTVYNNVQDALRAAISSSNNGSGGSTNPEPSFVVPDGYAQFIPGENIVKTQSADGVTVSVNRNMTNLESISIANGPTINQNGINMNGDRITNLADGVDPMDAVNVRQLNEGLSNTLIQANNYTDNAINRLGGQLEDYRRDANGGTAAAMAMSTIPQAQQPGSNMVGMGVSTWDNEQALAVGYSRYTEDGRFVLRATGTYNTRSQGGAAVGVGFQF